MRNKSSAKPTKENKRRLEVKRQRLWRTHSKCVGVDTDTGVSLGVEVFNSKGVEKEVFTSGKAILHTALEYQEWGGGGDSSSLQTPRSIKGLIYGKQNGGEILYPFLGMWVSLLKTTVRLRLGKNRDFAASFMSIDSSSASQTRQTGRFTIVIVQSHNVEDETFHTQTDV